ncbi:MAG: RluA family pseudouridine synthase [Clostridiales bacterium]|jgi:23S rRNA pseudouridine1911/1915/1917 synthase|nr:RluA family pseudouridine synthase [Clostridiales bacterium]
MKMLIADEEDIGKRLDIFASEEASISRASLQKLMISGGVLLNGRIALKSSRLKLGDLVAVSDLEPETLEAEEEDIPLDVLYEDKSLIVINKPKGMVVHPAPGHARGTVVNAVLYRCRGSLSGIGGAIRPGIVHRIDKDTSGVLVIAKTDSAHQALAMQLAEHSMDRRYRAIAAGIFKESELTVDKPIGRSSRDRKKMCVTENGGRRAITHFKVLENLRGACYIEARLETGRTHQIRVHSAFIGHPLLGDSIYAGKSPNLGLSGIDGQILHAKSLGFIHPDTGEYMLFDTELPEYFLKTLLKLGCKEKGGIVK